jgi:hypothetical protein
MPVAAGAHVMRDCTITMDGIEFAPSLTKGRLVPDSPIQQLRTLVPDGVITDVDSAVWTAELSGVQVWGPGGLAKALWDARGTEVVVVLQPRVGSGQDKATFTMISIPVEFGGEQGTFRLFEATFPVVGEPTFATSA